MIGDEFGVLWGPVEGLQQWRATAVLLSKEVT